MLCITPSKTFLFAALSLAITSVSSISLKDCNKPVTDKSLCVAAYEKEFGQKCKDPAALHDHLDRIWAFNADESQTYKQGVNVHHCTSYDEFAASHLRPVSVPDAPHESVQTNGSSVKMVEGADPPRSVDWTTKIKNPIKFQGNQCGDCWVFVGVALVEYAYAIAHNLANAVHFSEQYAMGRFSTNYGYFSAGCVGGNSDDVMKGAFEVGLPTEKEFPYDENQGPTSIPSVPQTISGDYVKLKTQAAFGNANNIDNAKLMAAVAQQPTGVFYTITTNFISYSGGVYDPDTDSCDGPQNHALVVVGYNLDSSDGPYWIVRNSWGDGWGENKGYGRIKMTNNKHGPCNMFGNGYLQSPLEFSKSLSGAPPSNPTPPSPTPQPPSNPTPTPPSPTPDPTPAPTPPAPSPQPIPQPSQPNPTPSYYNPPAPPSHPPSPVPTPSPPHHTPTPTPSPPHHTPTPKPSPTPSGQNSSSCQALDNDFVKVMNEVEDLLKSVLKKL